VCDFVFYFLRRFVMSKPTDAAEAISLIEEHAKKATPGQRCSVLLSAEVGQGAWQGNLGIQVIDEVPEGYELVENPTSEDLKLTLESGDGGQHRLDSLTGVKLYRPEHWGKPTEPDDPSVLLGPVLVLTEAREIVHRLHGPIDLPANSVVHCWYQRDPQAEADAIKRRED
jgi:hypothetical protein